MVAARMVLGWGGVGQRSTGAPLALHSHFLLAGNSAAVDRWVADTLERDFECFGLTKDGRSVKRLKINWIGRG